jgi:hypothetical protein
MRAFAEDEPGDRIAERLAAPWPAFRRVVARWREHPPHGRAGQGGARGAHARTRSDLAAADSHAWRRPRGGRGAALWNPPPFLTGCSQAAVLPGGSTLVRNYGLGLPAVRRGGRPGTAYAGRRVIGMLECLWGLLDGVNDAGLRSLAHLRGATASRRGLRHPDGDPLRAPDLRDHQGGHAGLASHTRSTQSDRLVLQRLRGVCIWIRRWVMPVKQQVWYVISGLA